MLGAGFDWETDGALMRSQAHRIAAALMTVVVLALGGCATPAQEYLPTYDATLVELDEMMESVQSRVGGEWEYRDSGARPCAINGAEGAQAPLQRSGPGVELADQQALVDDVVSMWTSAGLTPVVRELPPTNGIVITEINYPGEGTDENGMYVRVRVGTRATVVTGQTRCGTGDAAQINNEYWEQRGE